MNRYFSGLWHHPDFMKLWIGQTISGFGSRITRDALPLVAVMTLAASPSQMGLLTAFSSLPVLLFGLVAGVWVDRLPRRRIMIGADVCRLLLLLSIPFAALTGHLNIELVYVVMASMSLLGLLFDVAYRSALPGLVSREHLVEGNTKLATTDSLAEIGGPALAGMLTQLITAPLAILFDAVSFLFSAVSLALIRAPEPPPAVRDKHSSLWHEIVIGFRVIVEHRVLRTLVIEIAITNFFGSFIGTLYGYYAIRELHLSPAVLGVLVGAGGIGALVGSLLAGWVSRRFGVGRAITLAALCGGMVNLFIPLAGGPILVVIGCLLAGQILGDAIWTIYDITTMSLRQTLVDDQHLGRVNASIGFLAQGIAPIGALVAGPLAAVFGVRMILLIAVLGILITNVWMWFSPVQQWQTEAEPTI
jgi:MFS family permease